MYYIKKASYTVEAAFIFPLAFYSLLIFLYLFLMLQTEFMVYQGMLKVADGLYTQGTTMAYLKKSGLMLDNTMDKLDDLSINKEWISTFLVEGLSYAFGDKYIEKKFEEYCDENHLKFSLIKNKRAGIDFKNSTLFIDEGKMILVAEYTIKFPASIFKIGQKKVCQKLEINSFYGTNWDKVKEFDGEDDSDDSTPDDEDEKYVYITANGTVYHLDETCTYIYIVPDKIPFAIVNDIRSISGAIYHPCEECAKNKEAGTFVYITEYGTRYHIDKKCKKIDRHTEKIKEIFAKEMGLRVCSKCGMMGE